MGSNEGRIHRRANLGSGIIMNFVVWEEERAVTATVASRVTNDTAADVVRKFYAGINGRDLPSVENLISQNCVYEDLVFARPFVGRKEILEFFENFADVVSKDLQFVIDKISTEDSSAVGVTWHLEWKGKPFPFSKGCSFYQLEVVNGKRQIIYARDSVEPAIKPGKTALDETKGAQHDEISIPATSMALQTHWGTSPLGN
ncbi:hypothetical protein L484_013192 [Morus notabilis]|uniref:SnoaL-like domain-containing protein n=1 Tax=Morus notabilis TaxID=981085 RepID=W9RMD4_9ROSA|nr:hypothetical protein L484_013192 [Morus notabilis]